MLHHILPDMPLAQLDTGNRCFVQSSRQGCQDLFHQPHGMPGGVEGIDHEFVGLRGWLFGVLSLSRMLRCC